MNIILRYFLILILFLSSLGKFIEPDGTILLLKLFFNNKESFLIMISPYFIGIVELALAGSLTIAKERAKITIMILVLFLVFTGFLLTFPLRNIDIPSCGCFGIFLQGNSINVSLIRNLGLIIITLLLYYFERKSKKILINT